MTSFVSRILVVFVFFFVSISPVAAQVVVNATLTDTLSNDVDMDGEADQGDTLLYEVNIINLGPGDANNAMYLDSLDPNLTFVPGSLSSTPIARNDAYDSIGNVGIDVPAGSGVLANDNDPDGSPGYGHAEYRCQRQRRRFQPGSGWFV